MIKELNKPPDQVGALSYWGGLQGALIYHFGKAGDVGAMAEVLKALAGLAGRHAQDAGIQEALAQGYVNAIHSYGEAGHLDKALHLFQKLRDLNS